MNARDHGFPRVNFVTNVSGFSVVADRDPWAETPSGKLAETRRDNQTGDKTLYLYSTAF